MEYLNGTSIPIAFTVVCKECGGAGSIGPTFRGGRIECSHRRGRGRVGDCPNCSGSGYVGGGIKSPGAGSECSTCRGKGYIS